MLTHVHPKLPMRHKATTRAYYLSLGFRDIGQVDYPDYLIMQKDAVELHFFLFEKLDPLQNYGQVYFRLNDIDNFYKWLIDSHIAIHPNGKLETKPWGQREFSLLDPDHNLLTFGQNL
jgi:hypothetical protein